MDPSRFAGRSSPVSSDAPGGAPAGFVRWHSVKPHRWSGLHTDTITSVDCLPDALATSIKQCEWRKRVSVLILSSHFKVFISICICLTLCLCWIEADSSASDDTIPVWVSAIHLILLSIYMLEITGRIFMERFCFFLSGWNCFDLGVMASDAVVLLLSLALSKDTKIAWLRIFRVIRVFRIARVLRYVLLFRELYMIAYGMLSIGKALLWAAGVLWVVLSMFSIIAVEVLHPLVADLRDGGAFEQCERCSKAFDSVWNTNLLWLQSLIAGDSWGQTALPIIDKHPWTVSIFLSVLVISQLGLLNLIMTVMFDIVLEGRSQDDVHILAERDRELEKAFSLLANFCEQLDEDKIGELTLDEMLRECQNNKELRSTLQSMDVEPEDMQVVYALMDKNRNGSVNHKDLVQQLRKMKSSDSHTILLFIRYYFEESRKMLEGNLVDGHEETRRQLSRLNDDLILKLKTLMDEQEGTEGDGTSATARSSTDGSDRTSTAKASGRGSGSAASSNSKGPPYRESKLVQNKEPLHQFLPNSTLRAADLSNSIHAELERHSESMVFLLTRNQWTGSDGKLVTTGTTVGRVENMPTADATKKPEHLNKRIPSNSRSMLASELESLDGMIELESGFRSQVLARLTVVTQDIDSQLDRLRLRVRDLMGEMGLLRSTAKRPDRGEALGRRSDRETRQNLLLTVPPDSHRRVSMTVLPDSHRRVSREMELVRSEYSELYYPALGRSEWSLSTSQCCADPPLPVVKRVDRSLR